MRIPNAVSITWNSGGDPTGDYPKLVDQPTCFYSSGYKNSNGCGSYLGRWQDEEGGAFKYYFHKIKNDINPDNRGLEYSPSLVETNASCNYCPSTTCPQLQITGVNLSPAQPKIGDTVTLQIVYNWDANGFTETTNPFQPGSTDKETITWSGPGLNSTLGPRVTIGPFTSNGKRSYSINMNKYIIDPDQECCLSGGIIKVCGIINAGFNFDVDIGGDNGGPDDPDPVEPSISGTITGDSSLTLSNGSAVGNYEMDYVLDEGVGYQPSTREVTVAWDGGTAKWYDRDNGKNYRKTFNNFRCSNSSW